MTSDESLISEIVISHHILFSSGIGGRVINVRINGQCLLSG